MYSFDGKAEFSLLRSSVSHDPSEIYLSVCLSVDISEILI